MPPFVCQKERKKKFLFLVNKQLIKKKKINDSKTFIAKLKILLDIFKN